MAKKRTKKEMRQALDRVVEIVRVESDRYLCPYEFACWILYACDRSDAMMFAREEAKEIPSGEDEDPRTLTMEDELVEKSDRWIDDASEGFDIIEMQKSLAKRFDPHYRKPILGQLDWLDPSPPPTDLESPQVIKAAIDLALESSKRAAMHQRHQSVVDNAIDARRRKPRERVK